MKKKKECLTGSTNPDRGENSNELGNPNKLMDLTKTAMKNVLNWVKFHNVVSNEFKTKNCLR